MTQDNPEIIAGRYQLVERIGQGGMGRVWRGTDQHLFGREVAVKEILFPPGLEDNERSMLLRRFTSEARAAVILNHPGIITIHDVVEHNGAPVIVMEFVRGQSLAAAIREQGRLPVRRVAEIGITMLGALSEAHRAGIVHRDIKPDNVLLTKDRVVITDFGIAHLADATTKLSHSGTIIGTPQYMSPEQLEGKRPTAANDLWALGATLYHAVEGRPPFEAEGLHALAIAIFTQPHRPTSAAGPLAPVLEALLTKDPDRRATAEQAEALLAAALRNADADPAPGVPAGTPSPTPVPPASPVPPVPTPTALDAGADPEVYELPQPQTPAEQARVPQPADLPTDTPPAPVPAPPDLPPTDRMWGGVLLGGAAGPDGGTPVPAGGGQHEDVTAVPDGRPPARQGAARRTTVLAVALATLAVGGILTWTLTRDTGKGGGTGGSAGNDSASTTTVVIGLDAPLTGDLASLGLGIKNSADLAVKTANQTQAVPGVTFELQAVDDQAQPAVGQQNASRFVADTKVLGVVGPLNSSVAQAMLPELTTARLVDVSPSNTNPALSQGSDWAKGTKSRPYPSYFRVATTDAIQGPFAARYLHLEAKKSKLFVIDDQKTYGAGLAAGFRSEFTRIGGTVVGAEHINPGEHDFAALAAKVRGSGADAVYYGGEYPEAAPLSQALKQAGANVPLMGGDGIFDASYPTSNSSTEGDLATSIGALASELSGGQKFLADYKAAGYAEDAGIFGGYGYDAAWAVVEAVKAVVAANGGTLPSDARAKVADAMEDVAFDGVTGRVAFDEYGDTTNRQLTVYAVRSGQWSTVKTGTYAP